MRMVQRPARGAFGPHSGFTILEILIAMVVITVGVVGLLALFPIAIKSTSNAVKDSRASLLARSVQEAITVGMRVSPDEATSTTVLLQHDGFPAGGQLTIARPMVVGAAGQIYYPAPGLGTDPTGDTFRLATDPQALAAVQDIRDPGGLEIDPTEPTQQYSFGFLIQRVGTRLFQVTIDVFRGYRQDPGFPPDHLTGGWATSKHPTEVYSFTFLVAGN